MSMTTINTKNDIDIYCNFNHYNFNHLRIVLYFIFIFHKFEEFMECPNSD